MAPRTAKFHYIVACTATTMLFGVVSGHFTIGRELHVWPGQPRLWQIQPLDRESLGQRQSSERLQRSDDVNEGNSKEQIDQDLVSTQEGQVFNTVRPGSLTRWKVFARSKKQIFPGSSKVYLMEPYQVPGGAQGARAIESQVAPQILENGNIMN